MTPKRLIVLAVVAMAVLAVALISSALRGPEEVSFQGWVEGNFLFVSPDEVGRITKLSVREGDYIAAAGALFELDDDLQRAALAEAEAALVNAKITFKRAKDLLRKSVGTQKTYDDAEAALRTAEARINSARTHLKRRRVASPIAGFVQEVYYRVGEIVPSGRPVVSLLPPSRIRIRFFVPQSELPTLKMGQTVAIRCDGCPPGLIAHISFISTEAEYTPPVIYGPKERARLVFRVEARPDRPELVRVGQPVSIVRGGNADHSNAPK
ncbi:MAG: efflux RND transporter periplasmic adaptor subunit [Hyphomicrobiaceae bacterium]|nr:efflux RND transporter periplasmic adaptor subunit [Hyphomicrobiaceae bacterium]